MKVSIVIPIYNTALFVGNCLCSVLNQTWADLEVIIVNDCTPDNSMQVVEEVLSSCSYHPDVKVITHEVNKGISGTRNTGIQNATGDYVYFLDSDDYISPDCIELLASQAMLYDADVVVGSFEAIGNAHGYASGLNFSGLLDTNEAIIQSYVKDEWPVMVWNKLVRRELILKYNLFFEENIVHEDDLWSFRLSCCARRAYGLPRNTYFYVLHSGSLMAKASPIKLHSRIKVLELIYDEIISSEKLLANPYIYFFFETLKARYFDVIMYNSADCNLWRRVYAIIREKQYITALRASFTRRVSLVMFFRNLHYMLPESCGYVYFCVFVKCSYYFKVLPIKMRNLFVHK